MPQFWEQDATVDAAPGHQFWAGDAPADAPTAPTADEGTPRQQIARAIGLSGRYLGEGLPAIPALVGDAANTLTNLPIRGINAVAGTKIPLLTMPSTEISNGLTRLGLPTPNSTGERIGGAMSEALASLPGFAETAAASGIKALQPLTRDFGRQASSAMSAAFGQQGAKEMGLPAWAQILAGLGFGVAGGIRPGPPDPESGARLKAFDDSGIDPNVADVSQSKPLQMVRKGTEEIPFAGVPEREATRLQQAQDRTSDLARYAGTPSTPQGIGGEVQSGVESYRFGKPPSGMTQSEIIASPTRDSSISAKAGALYDRIPIAGNAVVEADKTRQAVQAAATKFANPELAGEFASPLMDRLTGILDRAGNMMTWDDLRSLKTEVRYLRNKAALDPTIDDRALAQVNGALSEDMLNGARVHGGDRAAQLVSRADNYYRQAMGSLTDNLKSVFGANRAESVYSQIKAAMSPNAARSDIAKLTELRRALPSDTWNDLSATVIDDLGKPTPGQAPAPGQPNFSVGRFVTDYASISPKAKDLLFNLADKADLRRSLDALYDATSSMKATDRLSNASNSGNRAALVAIGGGMMTAPTTTLSLLGAANITARAMYNPAFVRLMTKTVSATSPSAIEQTAAQVTRFALQNPQYAADAHELLRTLVPVQADSNERTK